MRKFLIIALMMCFAGIMQAQTEYGKKILTKAEAGNAEAQYDVCRNYEVGAYRFSKDNKKHIYWLKKSAENGCEEAQFHLANYYKEGKYGLQKSTDEYLKWLNKAAQNEYSLACFYLGKYYENIDKDKAVLFLKKALDYNYWHLNTIDNDAVEHLKKLGVEYDPTTKPRYLTKKGKKELSCAEDGDAEAQYDMSRNYRCGYEGFQKDETKMLYWLRKSAENGHSEAQYDLGEYYMEGKYGLQEDESSYLSWCKKAAENGYSGAFFSLGLYYELKNDKNKAISYIEKALDAYYEERGENDTYIANYLKDKYGVNYNPANKPASNNSLASNTSSNRTTTQSKPSSMAKSSAQTSSASSSSASSSQARQNSWRVNRPDGGYENWTRNADGSCFVVTVTPCVWCHGTKVCSVCNGQGGTMGRAYGGMWYACRSCAGTKICQNCHGKGTTTMTTQVAADGTAMGYDQNGRVATNGGSGSNGSSNSSSGKSSKNDKDAWYNKGVDVKEYAPNYTGSEEQYWCEKCKAWDYRHSHIIKK